MAVEGYTGTEVAKLGLAALTKVSATTFALTVGTVVVAVVAGAVLVAQMVDIRSCELESSGRKNLKVSQA